MVTGPQHEIGQERRSRWPWVGLAVLVFASWEVTLVFGGGGGGGETPFFYFLFEM